MVPKRNMMEKMCHSNSVNQMAEVENKYLKITSIRMIKTSTIVKRLAISPSLRNHRSMYLNWDAVILLTNHRFAPQNTKSHDCSWLFVKNLNEKYGFIGFVQNTMNSPYLPIRPYLIVA